MALKTCPFCGAKGKQLHMEEAVLKWYVSCGGCDTDGPMKDTYEEAREAWNTRKEG